MTVLSYAFLHMRRQWKEAMAIFLAYLAVMTLIISLQQSGQSRQAALDSMVAGIHVRGIVMDTSGAKSDGLGVSTTYYDALTKESLLLPYVKDVCLRASFSCNMGDSAGESKQLVAVTREEADYALRQSMGAIRYEDGYDATLWQGSELLCVIGQDLLPYVYEGVDSGKFVDISMLLEEGHMVYSGADLSISEWVDPVAAAFTLRVVGIANTSGVIYCPWEAFGNACFETYPDFSYLADSVSFTVSDNRHLDALREVASICFAQVNAVEPDTRYGYALVIQDDHYLRMTLAAEKNLVIFRLIQPILHLSAIGAGALLMMLAMRARKSELAVQRTQGAKRRTLFSQCVIEYSFLFLCGIALLFFFMPDTVMRHGAAVLFSFLAGALSTAAYFVSLPLISQIKELEE